MESPPAEMLSLTALRYTTPANFTLSQLPVPALSSPTDVLVRVHATSINPGELRRASGQLKVFMSSTFPHVLGLDLSGTVQQVGSAVTAFAPGDLVFGVLAASTGAAAEYVCVPSSTLTHRRGGDTSAAAAAAVPTVGLTALHALDHAEATLAGGLRGKTVFINAGLSGTGSIAVQLAKHVFGAARVVTTVSTSKVAMVPAMLGEGTVDHVVDYMTQDVLQEVEHGSVDLFLDTMREAVRYVALVKKGGIVVSVSTLPSGAQAAAVYPRTPWVLKRVLDVMDAYYRWRVARWGVQYVFVMLNPVGCADRLARLAGWMEDGSLTPVVGRTAELKDLKAVIEGCEQVRSGKGGVGKFVITMV